MIFPLVLTFIFGAVIGSFLNVVALRFNTGVGIGGRSKCMSCGVTLTWKELIPLASFLWQKGSCKKCTSKISWQYPLVEFTAGAVFVLLFAVFPPLTSTSAVVTLIYLAATCILLLIAVYDLKHKIIPGRFVYPLISLSFVSLFVGGAAWFHLPTVSALLAGPVIALPFALLWLVSRGAWMGLGDAKLMLALGWFLGIDGGVNALILSFWIAAAVSLIWLFATYKRFKPRTEVPFGPYLILGFYLVLLFGIRVIDITLVGDIIRSYL